MPDRKKVIMALQMLTTRVKKGAGTVIKISCNEEFISILSGAVELLKEQNELLKEQEAVEPKVMEPFRINSSGRMSRRKAWCGACGIGINMGSKFCDHCGRKVKWE